MDELIMKHGVYKVSILSITQKSGLVIEINSRLFLILTFFLINFLFIYFMHKHYTGIVTLSQAIN